MVFTCQSLSLWESRINCIPHTKGPHPVLPGGGLWLSILEKEEDGFSLLLGAVFLEQAQDDRAHDAADGQSHTVHHRMVHHREDEDAAMRSAEGAAEVMDRAPERAAPMTQLGRTRSGSAAA